MPARGQAAAFTLEPYDLHAARRLSGSLGVSDPVAATLVRRGYDTPEAARVFLEAVVTHDPFEFDSMEEVVAVILDAIEAGRQITVHGDYDVDGVCSTAIVVAALRDLGGRCDWYVPSRMDDGYGLTPAGVERLADRGTGLIVTVDCGIGSVEEVRLARQAGIEVIVTDHHQPGPTLPDCPILHPVVSNYPCPDLCATGVAAKLSAALRERGAAGAGDTGGDADLVALATVADLVPLRGENRTLVRAGLAEARRARRPGLRALMAAAGVDPAHLDEGDLAFRLAPRINAAGRLHRADAGIELMLSADERRATAIAAELEAANRERRFVEAEVLAEAQAAVRELSRKPGDVDSLVVAGEGWHPGVVGIVASRLVERHWRPAVVISLDPDGRGRGSARSIPGYDLLAGLRACEQHLVRYGGHAAAAGLELEADRIEPFREALCEHARTTLSAGDLVRSERVDAIVGGESLGLDIAEELERLAPFGKGNPAVRLLVPSGRVQDVQPMGEGKHARFSLESGRRRALGVAFGTGGELSQAGEGPHDLTLRLELNHWNGSVEPRVVLGELYPVPDPDPEGAGPPSPGCETAAGDEEWLHSFDAELAADPGAGHPAPRPRGTQRREVVDRRDASPVALLASLLSAGSPVLAICADTGRRRGLAERAAAPNRFGGGEAVLSCGHCAREALAAGALRVTAGGRGLLLADSSALARAPELPEHFEQVVLIDPLPDPGLESLAYAGTGFVHLAWGDPELDLALRVWELEWPSRHTLAQLYRLLRDAAGDGVLPRADLRSLVSDDRAHPPSAEQVARHCRVLAEVGLLTWEGKRAARGLRVVSSVAADLERSDAFRAYRARCEEGTQFLSSRRPRR